MTQRDSAEVIRDAFARALNIGEEPEGLILSDIGHLANRPMNLNGRDTRDLWRSRFLSRLEILAPHVTQADAKF